MPITAEAAAPAGVDPINRLPPEAQGKLRDLRDRVDRIFDLQRAESKRCDNARRDYQKAADRLRELEAAYDRGEVIERRTERKTRGDGLDPLVFAPQERTVTRRITVERDDKRLESERAAVARLRNDWERRRQGLAEIGTKSTSLAALRHNLEDWTAGIPIATDLRLFAGRVKIPKGDRLVAVEDIRTQIIALREEATDIQAAPPTPAEMKAVVRRQIEGLALKGRPRLAPTLELRAVDLPARDVLLHTVLATGGTGVVRGQIPDAVALLAWLLRDELIERLEKEIEQTSEPDIALTADERRKRLADIRGRTLGAERIEAAIIAAAAESGVTIEPRPDTDPRAFFGLADDLPSPELN